MNQILYSGKKENNSKKLIWYIAGVVVLIVLLVGFALINLFNHKILNGVYAAGINVSNLTKEEAVDTINQSYISTISKELVLTYEDEEIAIRTDEIGYNVSDASKLAEEAYQYGRNSNVFVNNFRVFKSYFNIGKKIDVQETIDRAKLEEVVTSRLDKNNVVLAGDFYKISEDKLLLTKAEEGKKIDFDALEKSIISALAENETYVEIPTIDTDPENVDIDAIYSKVHKDPVDASYKNGEIVSEENGIDFDINEAKEKYAKLSKGQTAEISLKVIEPNIKTTDLGDELFKTTIAEYETKFNENAVDIEYAVNKCNDIVIYPGEEFSFIKVLESGRASAGFDQVASTLYNAVLRADLKVTSRKAHSIWVQYVPQSTDVMVSSENADFKFENSRKYPIKISMSCANGICKASIYGVKTEEEPTVDVETKILETVKYKTEKRNDSSLAKGKTAVVQSPINGYVSEAYKVYYKDGKETSRKLVSKDTYSAVEEIIRVGTKTVKKSTSSSNNGSATDNQNVSGPNPDYQLPPGWDNPESGY